MKKLQLRLAAVEETSLLDEINTWTLQQQEGELSGQKRELSKLHNELMTLNINLDDESQSSPKSVT